MITLTQDPSNPERLIVSLTVTLWLDKVLLSTLSDEVAAAIRERAVRDLKGNSAVKKQIAAAATAKLLNMLGVPPEPECKQIFQYDVTPAPEPQGIAPAAAYPPIQAKD